MLLECQSKAKEEVGCGAGWFLGFKDVAAVRVSLDENVAKSQAAFYIQFGTYDAAASLLLSAMSQSFLVRSLRVPSDVIAKLPPLPAFNLICPNR